MAIALAENGDLVDDPDAVSWCACFARELELPAIEADDL